MNIIFSKKNALLRICLSYLMVLTLLVTMVPGTTYALKTNTKAKIVKKELKEHRTANTKIIDNGNGTLTKQIYTEPIHKKIGIDWVEISPKIIKTEEGYLTTENTDLDIQFNSTMQNGKYATLK
ncbi:hypothetical protein IC620_10065 [Hazenella sp. IB182357]|uniref:Uncharacterized protein n=1 Tax=Polycladospora coralii TaxID=2771432 RepID=A0A926NBH3_9BACL|nr:hypothetical protein [Polycladospora coralii]MBD1372700.1 hypothetical protein [Polycladospora coralii]